MPKLNFADANPVELAVVAYHDETATKLEKHFAKGALARHNKNSRSNKRISGKLDKHAGTRR